MATKIQQWIATQTEWVKSINPELRVSKSDTRCGARYAIVQDSKYGVNNLTDFMTRQEWYILRFTINICGEEAFKAGIVKRMWCQ